MGCSVKVVGEAREQLSQWLLLHLGTYIPSARRKFCLQLLGAVLPLPAGMSQHMAPLTAARYITLQVADRLLYSPSLVTLGGPAKALTTVRAVCYREPLKQKCRHFDEIFITGCTESCQNDNFRCSQWLKFHQNDNISVSVTVKQSRSYRHTPVARYAEADGAWSNER